MLSSQMMISTKGTPTVDSKSKLKTKVNGVVVGAITVKIFSSDEGGQKLPEIQKG